MKIYWLYGMAFIPILLLMLGASMSTSIGVVTKSIDTMANNFVSGSTSICPYFGYNVTGSGDKSVCTPIIASYEVDKVKKYYDFSKVSIVGVLVLTILSAIGGAMMKK